MHLHIFCSYGLKVTERAEYEFRAMDMGNVMHMALEKFAVEVRKEGLDWADLTEEERNRIIDSCLDQVQQITEIRFLKAVREMNICSNGPDVFCGVQCGLCRNS